MCNRNTSSYSYSYSTSSSSSGQSGTRIIRTVQQGPTTTYTTRVITNGGEPRFVQQAPTPQPTQTVAAAPKSGSAFHNECLVAHNNYRAKHSSPPLSLNASINNYAQEWAQRLSNEGRMYHRTNNKYGENIYWSSTQSVSAADAVKAWYDEIKAYNFSRGGFSSSTGHFTQVVWKKSRELGVGVASGRNGTYVVANYDPAGNFQGQFGENVTRS